MRIPIKLSRSVVNLSQKHCFFKNNPTSNLSNTNTNALLSHLNTAFSSLSGFESVSILESNPVQHDNNFKVEQTVLGRNRNKALLSARQYAKEVGFSELFSNRANHDATPQWLHTVANIFGGQELVVGTKACNLEMLEVEKFIASAYEGSRLQGIEIRAVPVFVGDTKVIKSMAYSVVGQMANGQYLQLEFKFNSLSSAKLPAHAHADIGKALARLTPCNNMPRPYVVAPEMLEARCNLLDKFTEIAAPRAVI